MSFRDSLMRLSFYLQDIIVPGLRYSQDIYSEEISKYINNNIKWLDIGCGNKLLPEWRLEEEKRIVKKPKLLVGLDADKLSIVKHRTIENKIVADIQKLPIKNDQFEVVTANMVLEHLCDPVNQYEEIYRILKPGGYFIFHTPNKYSYGTILACIVPESYKKKVVYFLQKRKEEDIYKTYYKTNSRKEIEGLARITNFNIVKVRMIVSSPQFRVIPIILPLELLLIKLLMLDSFKKFRTNIICVLQKKSFTMNA